MLIPFTSAAVLSVFWPMTLVMYGDDLMRRSDQQASCSCARTVLVVFTSLRMRDAGLRH